MRWTGSVVLAMLVTGCQAEPAQQLPQSKEPTSHAPHRVDVSKQGDSKQGDSRKAQIAVADPSVDRTELELAGEDWRTEQLSQRIDSHLKTLSQAILEGRVGTAELEFVDPSVRCTVLRPNELDVVYDNFVVVRRWRRDVVDSDAVPGGEASFRSALKAINPISSSEPNIADLGHGKFKIVGITQRQDRLDTELFWQLSVGSPHLNYQQNARWSCQWRVDGDQTRLESIALLDYQEIETASDRRFIDCTAAAAAHLPDFARQFGQSIDFWLDRLEHRFAILASSYQGISVADVNGDGLEDVYVSQPGGVSGGLPNRLLIQQSDGTVIDRSAESGLDWLIETHSALFVDLDNDGDQDAIVATVMGLVFAANDGQGHFQRRAIQLTPDAPPMSLAAADFDEDGDLDVYACCYSPRSTSPLMGRPIPYHDANNGGRNVMLRNDRDWRFRDVTRQVGMDQNNRRFSFAACWEDFDNDGDADLYVANDYGRNNLFRNDSGVFRDVAADFGVEDISAGMSVTWGDYDRDGWMDLYVSNMWSSAGHRIAYQRQFQADADTTTRAHYQRHARGNSLFANRLSASAHRMFHDVSVGEGVTMGRWAWASQFADLNNDGHLDLVVANGFITQEDTSDL